MSDKTRHLDEDDLTLFHYGELEDRATAGRHLMGCSRCRRSYDELLAVLEAVDSLPLPSRDAGYGAEVWERLRPRLPSQGSANDGRRRWTVAAALLLVLVTGFLAGRFLQEPAEDPAMAEGIPPEVRERILRAAVGEHLERSGRMLVEIANDGDALDPDTLQGLADGLLGTNRLYRQTLTGAGQADLLTILEDLERILLDIAHSDAGQIDEPGDALESIRARIDERGLLFRLRIVVSRLRQETGTSTGNRYAERT